MRLSKKLVKDVVGQVAGDDAIQVTELIYKDSVAEENIAECMECEIKETRNILYKLQEHNLVAFKRKRNDENGWYTYFWSFNKKRVKIIARKILEAKLERYQYMLGVEENTQFFSCDNKCLRVDFESVLNLNYKCPECGCCLSPLDTTKRKRHIKRELKKIKEELREA